MQATLVVVSGKTDKRQLTVKLPAILGRSRQADLTIAHSLISRKHCALLEREGVVVLRDLGSLNGTYIRGEKVTGDVRLFPSDEFSIGPLTFRVQYDYRREGAAAPTAFGQNGTVVVGQPPSDAAGAPRPPVTSAEPGLAAPVDLAAGASLGMADESSGSSSSRVRLIDQGRIPLPHPVGRPPDTPANMSIELNETRLGADSEPAVAPPEAAASVGGMVPFSIAPEDGQLPDFAHWRLADETPSGERLKRPDEAPPIQTPRQGDPASDTEAKPDEPPKGPAADSDSRLRDFFKRFK